VKIRPICQSYIRTLCTPHTYTHTHTHTHTHTTVCKHIAYRVHDVHCCNIVHFQRGGGNCYIDRMSSLLPHALCVGCWSPAVDWLTLNILSTEKGFGWAASLTFREDCFTGRIVQYLDTGKVFQCHDYMRIII